MQIVKSFWRWLAETGGRRMRRRLGISCSDSINKEQTMKTSLFSIGLSLVLMEPALAQTNQPGPASAVTNNVPADALVTETGMVYKKFQVEKADPAGLIISYLPVPGGIGLEKVPFDVLSDDWRKRYEYDPRKAAIFIQEQREAMGEWREKMIADEKAYRERQAQLEAAEEAAATQATNAPAAETTNAPAIETTNSPAMTETNQPPPPGSQ
jgi:hypothetical protein